MHRRNKMIRNNLTGLMITRQHTFKNHESLRARCIKLRPSIFSVVTKTRNHPKPPKTTNKTTQNHPKTIYKINKTNQNDPKPATIYPNTTGLRDICIDGRL